MHGPFHLTRSVTLVLLLLAMAAIASAQTPDVSWSSSRGEWVATIRYVVPASSVDRLEVRNFTGNLDLRGTAKDQADVEVTFSAGRGEDREGAEKALQAVMPEFALEGGILLVETPRHGRWRLSHSSRFELSAIMPRSCEVDAATSGGNVDARDFEAKLDLATSGGNMRVESVKGNVDMATSGGNITLREVTGDVSAATSGGNIDVTGLTGDVELATSGGNIDIETVKGALDGHTSGGNIRAADVVGRRLSLGTTGGQVRADDLKVSMRGELSTSGGDVHLDHSIGAFELATHGGDLVVDRHQGVLSLTTSAGDIRVSELAGDVEAKTGTGEIDVELAKAGAASTEKVSLNTGNGDIHLALPADFGCFIEATVARTVWHDGGIQSDFPLKRVDRDGNSMQATGKVNDGHVPVELITGHGKIVIRKR